MRTNCLVEMKSRPAGEVLNFPGDEKPPRGFAQEVGDISNVTNIHFFGSEQAAVCKSIHRDTFQDASPLIHRIRLYGIKVYLGNVLY